MANEKRIPAGAKRKRLIVGTVVMLAIAFILMIIFFVALTSLLPHFTGRCVAVVDISMPFTVEGQPMTLIGTGYPGSEELAYAIKELNVREDVGAILFVFNSGGGSVVATHEIYDAVEAVEKPKVSYFREIAASGAYYVASGTDYIIADPASITGNIGVRSVTFISVGGLMEELGINATTVTSGEYKDIGSPYRNMTEEEYQIMQTIVDEVFEEFKNLVKENRKGKLRMSEFENITDGRIMSGKQAVEVGLVDELGNKEDAIMKAAELGGIEAETVDDVRICYVEVLPQEGGLFSMESFLGSIGEAFRSSLRFQ